MTYEQMESVCREMCKARGIDFHVSFAFASFVLSIAGIMAIVSHWACR